MNRCKKNQKLWCKMPRKRQFFSLKDELLKKSQEAALSAVEIFNNPNISFKSETFIVLMVIAWTYLMHAYYKQQRVDYCYYKKSPKGRKIYDKTKNKAKKHWELERCIQDPKCPLCLGIQNNLRFLIGIRHEIEHQMTTQIDDLISAKFQACCINYNNTLKEIFGKRFALDNKLGLAIQFFGFDKPQIKSLKDFSGVPKNVIDFITGFEKGLSSEDLLNPNFSYKVIYTPYAANHLGQADIAYHFIDEKSAEGKEIQNVLIKNSEAEKFKPGYIVGLMKEKGFRSFNMHQHTLLWKRMDAKNKKYRYGCDVAGTWYWYQKWVDKVEELLSEEVKNATC